MNPNNDVVIDLAKMTSLDPDTIEQALDEVVSEYGQEEVDEGLAEMVPEIPSGEGLSKSEARALLIDTINKSIQLKNRKATAKWSLAIDRYWEAKKNGEKSGQLPEQPFLMNTFTNRHINQVVNIARHRGGYESLLEAAGYAPLKRR